MRFGPFELGELERIEEILKQNSIDYDIFVDNKEMEREEMDFQRNPGPGGIGFDYDSKSAFVDIDDKDLNKVGNSLECFGVIAPDKEYIGKSNQDNEEDSDNSYINLRATQIGELRSKEFNKRADKTIRSFVLWQAAIILIFTVVTFIASSGHHFEKYKSFLIFLLVVWFIHFCYYLYKGLKRFKD